MARYWVLHWFLQYWFPSCLQLDGGVVFLERANEKPAKPQSVAMESVGDNVITVLHPSFYICTKITIRNAWQCEFCLWWKPSAENVAGYGWLVFGLVISVAFWGRRFTCRLFVTLLITIAWVLPFTLLCECESLLYLWTICGLKEFSMKVTLKNANNRFCIRKNVNNGQTWSTPTSAGISTFLYDAIMAWERFIGHNWKCAVVIMLLWVWDTKTLSVIAMPDSLWSPNTTRGLLSPRGCAPLTGWGVIMEWEW